MTSEMDENIQSWKCWLIVTIYTSKKPLLLPCRRRVKVQPVMTPEGVEMEEVSEYETDTSEDDDEDVPKATARDVDIVMGDEAAAKRWQGYSVLLCWILTPYCLCPYSYTDYTG